MQQGESYQKIVIECPHDNNPQGTFLTDNAVGLLTVLILALSWEWGRRQFNKTHTQTESISKELRSHDVQLKAIEHLTEHGATMIQESDNLRHMYLQYLKDIEHDNIADFSEQDARLEMIRKQVMKVSHLLSRMKFYTQTAQQSQLIDAAYILIYRCYLLKDRQHIIAYRQLASEKLFRQFFIVEELTPRVYLPNFIKEISEGLPGDEEVQQFLDELDKVNVELEQIASFHFDQTP